MKYYLRRIRINRQGYDRTGAYWGIGWPLYEYVSEDERKQGELRAMSRESAKDTVVSEVDATAAFFN